MNIKNNNAQVIKRLAKTSFQHHTSRNYLLVFALVSSIILIFSLFTISFAQLKTEYILSASETGSLITITLDEPSEKQIHAAQELSYISDVGKETKIAMGLIQEDDSYFGSVVDKEGFENFYAPVFTNIIGSYPQKVNEVMLPMSVLRKLEITPKVGKEINLTFMNYARNSQIETTPFVLSGYFEESAIFAQHPTAFFSNAYRKSLPSSSDVKTQLIMKQNNRLSSAATEKKLYDDIAMRNDTQKFIILDTIEYQVAEKIFGNYDTILLLVAIVIISVCLLINNITQMSLEKNIREFGLLRTIGTTKLQVYRIQQRQFLYIAIRGTLIGIILSFASVYYLLPTFLSGMIIKEGVNIKHVLEFDWILLLVIIVIALCITFVSMMIPLRRIFHISAKDALYFTYGKYKIRKKEVHRKQKVSLIQMAWRNISTNKGKLLKIIFSLFFSSILCLSSVVIVQILDYSDIYKGNADFEIDDIDSNNPDPFINETFIKETKAIDGVKDIDFSYQAYAQFDMSKRIWTPLMKMSKNPTTDVIQGGFQIIRDSEIQLLSTYLKKQGTPFNEKEFKEGKSVFNLHRHVFSNAISKEANAISNETISILGDHGESIGEFKFHGYLDYTNRNFPTFKNMSRNSDYVPYIMISEQGFERLGIKKTVSQYDINVVKEKEKNVHKELNMQIEQRKSHHTSSVNPSILLCVKSDLIKEARDYINSISLCYFSISFVFMALAILNYFNVMHSSLTNRKKELVTLESIGMTRSQLRTLLVYEGLTYSGIVIAMLLSLGTGILYYVSAFIQRERMYSSFIYPSTFVILLFITIVVISVILPLLIYHNIEKRSIVERLRK